jgi:hypothetical protein
MQHPSAEVAMAWAASGARATVFNVSEGRQSWALKVFKRRFRSEHQSTHGARISKLKGLPGLRAAERLVIALDDPAVQKHPDLAYAVFMPWITGSTWFDTLAEARSGERYLEPAVALRLCHAFLSVMTGLAEYGLAHTDVASGNVVIDPQQCTVELIDLEEMFGPGFPQPSQLNRGSPGYAHPETAHPNFGGFWSAESDRFATAVLAAEILALADPRLVEIAGTAGGFFDEGELQGDSPRARSLRKHLHLICPPFGALFDRAWTAPTVAVCPSVGELLSTLAAVIRDVPALDSAPMVPWSTPPRWMPSPARSMTGGGTEAERVRFTRPLSIGSRTGSSTGASPEGTSSESRRLEKPRAEKPRAEKPRAEKARVSAATPAPPPTAGPAIHTAALSSTADEEVVYFWRAGPPSLVISNRAISLGGQRCAMTGLRTVVLDRVAPRRVGEWGFGVVGTVVGLVGLATPGTLALSVGLAGVASALGMLVRRRSAWILRLERSGGVSSVQLPMGIADREVRGIVDAINQAKAVQPRPGDASGDARDVSGSASKPHIVKNIGQAAW